ncbi:uncharacterized protein DSM5745_10211 [Aspergillus mulundensis]|uniref:Uncharacterized protein n=1 Tax=Aspergillus mulundensis TaxID=1810919 RepID=A0A3D8QN71_9EURO|nr:hypothetical protein DSM5745_10211 [Aspergillus mulundensis]RDW63100.1 hypothetical protein DSM5745_10211 [Aspergillus mulundensis]
MDRDSRVELEPQAIQIQPFQPRRAGATPKEAHRELDRVSHEDTGQPFRLDSPKTLEQGIAITSVAALSPELEMNDPGMEEFLWELSEELVGGFEPPEA